MGDITQRAQTFEGTAQRCAPGNGLPQRRLFPAVLPALNSLQWSRHGSLLPLLDPLPWEDETQGAPKNALSQQKPAISPIGLLRQNYYLLNPPVNRLLARLCQAYHSLQVTAFRGCRAKLHPDVLHWGLPELFYQMYQAHYGFSVYSLLQHSSRCGLCSVPTQGWTIQGRLPWSTPQRGQLGGGMEHKCWFPSTGH